MRSLHLTKAGENTCKISYSLIANKIHAECKISNLRRNSTPSAISTTFCIIIDTLIAKLLVFVQVYTHRPRIKFRGIVASTKTTKLITPRNFLHLRYTDHSYHIKHTTSQRNGGTHTTNTNTRHTYRLPVLRNHAGTHWLSAGAHLVY